MTGQARTFDEIKYMYFYIKYDKLLKKYNKIWNEVSSSINKGFDNKPVCSEKFLRFNIFLNGIPKEGYYYIFLVISIDFGLKKDKKYYPKVSLKACKYIGEEKR